MTAMRPHGGLTAVGKNNQFFNLELEELATDPINPDAGRIWQNTTLGTVRVAVRLGSVTTVISLASLVDTAALQTTINSLSAQIAALQAINNDQAFMAMATSLINTQTTFVQNLPFPQ